jgi:tRNA pseudouridine55 synthase
MNNFYLIDKPLGITSFDIIRKLKKKLNIKRIWHTWTLDPLATWLVLIAVGNYTKLIPYLEKDTKIYEFELNLDWVTESFDLAEKIIFLDKNLQKKAKKEITKQKIEKILKENFLWIIEQVPPKYSAIKINWQRAYSLARKWEKIEIKKRKVKIFEIEIIDYLYPKLTLKAKVWAWTYIRSIAFDLGKILKTWAYITKLRRIQIWHLDLNLSQNLEDFTKEKFLEPKKIFNNKKFISLDKKFLQRLDNWLETFLKDDFFKEKNIKRQKKSQEFFVENSWKITHIIEIENNLLKAKRKI